MLDEKFDDNQYESTIDYIDTTAIQMFPQTRSKKHLILRIFLIILIFSSGLGSGYFLWGRESMTHNNTNELTSLVNSIFPKEGINLKIRYGNIGPALIDSGTIDLKTFVELYEQSGQPLSDQEIEILTKGSQNEIVITRENAHFLLNYFWALGLTNKNPLLDNGPIQQASNGQIDRFASTGGWTIGTKPVKELFSSAEIVTLSPEQQAFVQEVSQAVYRPCCDNPTHFPDCNHGMAMLGLLELMASQNATEEEMFKTAKYANAFWFPQQTLEQAMYFKATQKENYKNIDAKQIVGYQYSSGSGFQNIHQWLSQNGLLEKAQNSGSNCGV
ncbi:MAG: hypothetical protein CL609_15460 [Anaerolineaceae bacterium]|nr:hypothetical protein [Anaerolineaceae bacterium]